MKGGTPTSYHGVKYTNPRVSREATPTSTHPIACFLRFCRFMTGTPYLVMCLFVGRSGEYSIYTKTHSGNATPCLTRINPTPLTYVDFKFSAQHHLSMMCCKVRMEVILRRKLYCCIAIDVMF